MEQIGAITEYIDVAQIVLYVFWVFFALVIYHLIQENKREGYPLVTDSLDPSKRRAIAGITSIPSPKVFTMADGTTYHVPDPARADTRQLNATAMSKVAGFAIEPTGDPLVAGVGPGSWAERDDVPDLTIAGTPKFKPMRLAPDFHVDENDPDPRGMAVMGADGESGGTVKDLWIDPPEHLVRYLEVDIGGGKSALFPINLCVIDGNKNCVNVLSLMSGQFANIPQLKNPDQVTRLEEELIFGYFGAGTLYADASRAEPLI